MQDYVSSVLFVHTIETEPLVERLRDHPSQATIKPVLFDALMADSERVAGRCRACGGQRAPGNHQIHCPFGR